MKKMKFSIIVPVYNLEDYICQCIESVLCQDYYNWELILVNDGSKDKSLEICTEYSKKDSRIVLINQPNQGVSSARNRGIEIAKGDYVTFLDGDDYWIRNNVLSSINTGDMKDLYYMTRIVREYPNGRRVEINYSDKFYKRKEEKPLITYFTNVLKGNWACYFIFVKRKILFDNNIFFDIIGKIGEDADWFFRTCRWANSLGLIESTYYCYRVQRNGSAMSQKSETAILSYFKIVNKWGKLSELDFIYHDTYIMLCNNSMNYLLTVASRNQEKRKEIINEVKKSGAWEDSNTYFSRFVRILEKKFGAEFVFFILKFLYFIKLYGSKIKSKLFS